MVLEQTDPVDKGAAKSLNLQLNLDLGDALSTGGSPCFASSESTELKAGRSQGGKRATASESQPIHQNSVGVDVASLYSQMQKHVDRIHDLERALDQSLILVDELRRQLVDQELLENQLAATEEIANIQQRAITQLKQQLTHHQIVTADQSTNTASLPAASATEDSAPTQAVDLINRSSQKVFDLTQQLENCQKVIEQLETELDRAHLELQEQQALIDNLQQASTPAPNLHNTSLDEELFTAHCKIQDLETQISKQVTTQAILQHTCHELEQARDRYHIRAQELELQTADMQEQILKQAQQASEYETAIQHWKDRYTKSQNFLKRINDLIEQMEIQPTTELTELLVAIQVVLSSPEPENASLTSNHPPKMDIPDFLARHHRYRVRS